MRNEKGGKESIFGSWAIGEVKVLVNI